MFFLLTTTTINDTLEFTQYPTYCYEYNNNNNLNCLWHLQNDISIFFLSFYANEIIIFGWIWYFTKLYIQNLCLFFWIVSKNFFCFFKQSFVLFWKWRNKNIFQFQSLSTSKCNHELYRGFSVQWMKKYLFKIHRASTDVFAKMIRFIDQSKCKMR